VQGGFRDGSKITERIGKYIEKMPRCQQSSITLPSN